MYWIVYLESVYTNKPGDRSGLLFEGTKEECELIYGAFVKYNNGHNICMEEL